MHILNIEIGIETVVSLCHLFIKNRYGKHDRRKVTRHSRYVRLSDDIYIV